MQRANLMQNHKFYFSPNILQLSHQTLIQYNFLNPSTLRCFFNILKLLSMENLFLFAFHWFKYLIKLSNYNNKHVWNKQFKKLAQLTLASIQFNWWEQKCWVYRRVACSPWMLSKPWAMVSLFTEVIEWQLNHRIM